MTIPWIQPPTNGVSEYGSATVLNRALKDILTRSGYDVDAIFNGIPSPVYNIKSFAGSSFGEKLQAAHDALPITGGTIDARSVEGTGDFAAGNFHVTKPRVKVLLGLIRLFTGGGNGTIVVDSTKSGFHLKGPAPYGMVIASPGSGSPVINHTGTGPAILAGSVGAITYNVVLEDICIDIASGGDGASGIQLSNVIVFELNKVRVIGKTALSNQAGIVLLGTGGYTGSGIMNAPWINNCRAGISFTGTGVNAGNAVTILGGTVAGTANSLGVVFEASSNGNTILGTDFEGHAVAVDILDGSSGNNILGRFEGNTVDANFGVATSGNDVYGGGLVNVTGAGMATNSWGGDNERVIRTTLKALAYKVGANQVVGARGAAVADATDPASTMARLNDLLARLRTHGLIA